VIRCAESSVNSIGLLLKKGGYDGFDSYRRGCRSRLLKLMGWDLGDDFNFTFNKKKGFLRLITTSTCSDGNYDGGNKVV